MNLETIKQLKQKADDAYFNSGSPIMDDEEYDNLIENLNVLQVGCAVSSNERKIKLPLWMGSLNKIYNDSQLDLWKKRNDSSFFIQPKLDGVSCLIYKNQIFTRGDGYYGTDITTIFKSFIPKISNKYAFRGEIVIDFKTFEEKYKTKFKNPRSMVSGIVNSINPENAFVSDLKIIIYETINLKTLICCHPLKQKAIGKRYGYNYIKCKEYPMDNLNSKLLSEIYKNYLEQSQYPSDGLVVWRLNEDGEPRNLLDNPKYTIAFKIKSESIKQATVLSVEWNIGKAGIFHPRVIVDPPVNIYNSSIKYFSGFNANFIFKNKIGPGAILNVTKSGCVIPNIISVYKPTNISFDEIKPPNSKWDDNHVELKQIIECLEFNIKKIVNFSKVCKIDHVKEGTINKLFEIGIDTISKFLNLNEKDLIVNEKYLFGKIQTIKIIDSIKKTKNNLNLETALLSFNVFDGLIGLKKIKLLVDLNPLFYKLEKKELYSFIVSIPGFSKISADRIIESIPKIYEILPFVSSSIVENKISTKNLICLSGFRTREFDNDWEISETITKQVKYLIVKEINPETSKSKKALKYNIPIILYKDFLTSK